MNTEANNSFPPSDNESVNPKLAEENEEKQQDSNFEETDEQTSQSLFSSESSSSDDLTEDKNRDEGEAILSELLQSDQKSSSTLTEDINEENLNLIKEEENESTTPISDSLGEETENSDQIEQEEVKQTEELLSKSNEDNLDQGTTNEVQILMETTSLKPLDSKQQINLTQKGDCIHVFLPLDIHSDHNQWQRILTDFQARLRKIEKNWLPDTKVNLQAQDRLLDTRQIQDLNRIFDSVQLKLDLVITKRRQTAVAVASAGYSVKQESANLPLIAITNQESETQDLAEPLYFNNTIIRSGEEIYHASSVIIRGDVNPGATIIADGDIIVWGTLKGIAHAGAKGNRKSLIMALKMTPTQIRIADLVATAPDTDLTNAIPEVAYISSNGIRIRGANSFARNQTFLKEKQFWVDKKDRLNLDL